jgi:hypothetical protein
VEMAGLLWVGNLKEMLSVQQGQKEGPGPEVALGLMASPPSLAVALVVAPAL